MITLEKGTDTTPATVRESGPNTGSGPVRFIGRHPVAKTRRAEILMGGGLFRRVVVTDHPVVFGAVEITAHLTDGGTVSRGSGDTFATVRDRWIRYAVTNGTYAGMPRMR